MAEVRARIDFKVGVTSSIDAELLSFHGLKTDKEHVAVILNQQTRHKTYLLFVCTLSA